MEPKLGWIIVVVLVMNNMSFVSNVRVRVGSLRYLHRHPKLRSCADKVLKENLYVGGRVHMLTGECEGLNRSWAINQTVQSGYAYAKKVSVQDSYIPPLENPFNEWNIPVVLREGAIVATVVEFPPEVPYFGLNIHLYDSPDIFKWGTYEIMMRAEGEHTEVEQKLVFCEAWKSNQFCHDDVVCTLSLITKETKRKLSYRAHARGLQLLVDDHEICTVNTTVDPTTLRSIHVNIAHAILHGIECTDA